MTRIYHLTLCEDPNFQDSDFAAVVMILDFN